MIQELLWVVAILAAAAAAAAVASGPVEVKSQQQFEAELERASKQQEGMLALVFVMASWSERSRLVAPLLDWLGQLIKEEDLLVLKVDVDELSQVAALLKIDKLPTSLLIRNLRAVDEVIGDSQEALVAAIKRQLPQYENLELDVEQLRRKHYLTRYKPPLPKRRLLESLHEFNQQMQEAGNGTVLVAFTSELDSQREFIRPILERLAEAYGGDGLTVMEVGVQVGEVAELFGAGRKSLGKRKWARPRSFVLLRAGKFRKLLQGYGKDDEFVVNIEQKLRKHIEKQLKQPDASPWCRFWGNCFGKINRRQSKQTVEQTDAAAEQNEVEEADQCNR